MSSTQDDKINNLTEKVENLDNKVDNFVTNHFQHFVEQNALEHGEIKEKLGESKGQMKYIYLLFSALVIPLILFLLK